jgi:hypothetical protein
MGPGLVAAGVISVNLRKRQSIAVAAPNPL